MIAAAMEYAEAGDPVFPLHGKQPLTRHGHHDATTDPAVITAWWTRWPNANIGRPVLSEIVLDLDPRHGGDLALLERPLPPTLTCWSGRGDGGRHLYFTRPSGKFTSTRLPAGFDLKVNGYCVVPPSLHPATGQPYRWEQHPVAPLPSLLRELLMPPRPKVFVMPRRGRGNGQPLVDFVRRQHDGNRNKALFWAACRAAERGLLDDRLADEFVAAAVSVGCVKERAEATVESAKARVTK